MASQIIVRTYQAGNLSVEVPFTGQAFFNATEVAKPFGKVPSGWLRTQEAKEYIKAVEQIYTSEKNQLVIIKKGGEPHEQGTWLHPKLAIAFARWLDVRFAVWCDLQIETILREETKPSRLLESYIEERHREAHRNLLLNQQVRDQARMLHDLQSAHSVLLGMYRQARAGNPSSTDPLSERVQHLERKVRELELENTRLLRENNELLRFKITALETSLGIKGSDAS